MNNINLRVKKMREKLGFDLNEFCEILFEDYPSDLAQKHAKDYHKVERGEKPADLFHVEHILIKFEINALWLLTGRGTILPGKDAVKQSIAIELDQKNIEGSDNTIKIVYDQESINKLISEKDHQISELKNKVLFLTEVFLEKEKKPKTFPSHQVAAILLMACISIGFLFFNQNQQSQTQLSSIREFPRNEFLEKYKINKKSSYYKVHHQAQGQTATLQVSNTTSTLHFQVLNYRNEVYLEKEISPNERQTSFNLHNWPPGIYYCVLIDDFEEIIFVDSLIKN